MTITYGKNKLNAMPLFIQRKLYEYFAYPYASDAAIPIDIVRDKVFYGRLDYEGNLIIPIETRLKRLESAPNKNLFAIDFVADAFEDFRQNFLFINKEDTTGTPFQFLTPHESYQNVMNTRERSMQILYTTFTNSYLSLNKRYEKVVSFKSFLTLFKQFMSDFSTNIPITLTNYLLSSFASPLSSGIMIEIAEASYADDQVKCETFFQDPSFPCYSQAAAKYGFRIDKNVPWRLIADLKSPCMQKYMSQYKTQSINSEPVSFGSFFTTYYNTTSWLDMQLIKDTLATFYYSYVNENPVFTQYYFSPQCQAIQKKTIKRHQVSKEFINQHFSNDFWLNYYIEILSYEIKDKKSLRELRKLVLQSQTVLREKGLAEASKYVYDSFKPNMLTFS